jgi:hypothetical protein
VTVEDLTEVVAGQRQHARHGFGGRPPAGLDIIRARRARLGYLKETDEFLIREAVTLYHRIRLAYVDCPYPDLAFARQLMRERGVSNVPKLLAARQKAARQSIDKRPAVT